ncbi:MAG: glycosyltransferase family 4 protein [Burkholderiales bacterium]|nr:glycosyltransferase family 4 protein [Burkholderiales bacterium]
MNLLRDPGRRLRILTWHVHGNYLYYLTQVPHDFYLVTDEARSVHHTGRSGTLPWGSNVHEVSAAAVRDTDVDIVLFQSKDAWLAEQHTLLSPAQQRGPRVYLEHDPPQAHPSDTVHWMDDPNVLLVHVTPFNALMWHSGQVITRVVEHGVKLLAPARHTGERASGIVVVNNIDKRGRRLGYDIFRHAQRRVPLSLVGMGSERCGGEGEVANTALPGRVAAHRFFFNPIRYTSLGLAIIEAMMVGTPVVGLATTELVTVIDNGRNGLIDTRLDLLIDGMQQLLADPGLARELGEAGRRTAEERFAIERFVADWNAAFRLVLA